MEDLQVKMWVAYLNFNRCLNRQYLCVLRPLIHKYNVKKLSGWAYLLCLNIIWKKVGRPRRNTYPQELGRITYHIWFYGNAF